MTGRELIWNWHGQPVRLGLDEAGEGATVLLLPALSSISTRGEMIPLMRSLSSRFRVVTVDWPGFGDRPRPRIDWTPDSLQAFLEWLLGEVVSDPLAIVAAGHAAGYVLHHFAARPGAATRLVLVAPTWRGPFPTMMGGQRPWFRRIRAVIDAPLIGPALYALNLSGPVVRKMVVEHVYSDKGWLTPDRLAAKRAVTAQPGARHASVRFVTGGLDRIGDRDGFIDLARGTGLPTLLVYGAETPPKSRAEMDALSAVAGIETVRLGHGKLAIHEEFADEVAGAIMGFLAAGTIPGMPAGQTRGDR
ncbi:alpha/beta fold hydrolase [Phreatobacter stygius]|uniref:Alpha/beta hydrolase n=1 Tax=Phreatobacter stygius TaxID=1940610 RepID=A0A4D7AVY8_9HYPH|nr:alpha/beta hydrolase [Phreatobacter stygius]QCI64021.1 alpha/beta hydrolase [Phreatobacter stygius]